MLSLRCGCECRLDRCRQMRRSRTCSVERMVAEKEKLVVGCLDLENFSNHLGMTPSLFLSKSKWASIISALLYVIKVGIVSSRSDQVASQTQTCSLYHSKLCACSSHNRSANKRAHRRFTFVARRPLNNQMDSSLFVSTSLGAAQRCPR